MIVPNPRTWGIGEPPDYKDRPAYSIMNTELYTNLEFLLNPPMCKLYGSVAQSIPNAAWTALGWDSEEADTDNMHISTPNSKIIPKTAGWYIGSFGVGFGRVNTAADTTGRRLQAIRKNGTTPFICRYDSRPGGAINRDKPMKGHPFMVYCNGTTDYVEAICYQESGGVLPLNAGTPTNLESCSEFYMRWYRS